MIECKWGVELPSLTFQLYVKKICGSIVRLALLAIVTVHVDDDGLTRGGAATSTRLLAHVL